jgi:hypothetical protein
MNVVSVGAAFAITHPGRQKPSYATGWNHDVKIDLKKYCVFTSACICQRTLSMFFIAGFRIYVSPVMRSELYQSNTGITGLNLDKV